MRSFLVRYDFSKIATGKILETIIIRGEVMLIAKNADDAKVQAVQQKLIPDYIIDKPNCIEVWAVPS